ncbi:hypothetical protein PMAYCL1PPCAC_29820, partial [Pristionchus mayeri]
CHQCFERSQRSSKENRVSRIAEPLEREEQPPSTKQVEPSSNDHKGETDENSSTADKEAGKEITAPPHLPDLSARASGRKG